MADQSEIVPTVVFVLFPSLEARGLATLEGYAAKLKEMGYRVWVANEGDAARRLKALQVRELYNVGRAQSIVMTNADGVWLNGWYEHLPPVDELRATVEKYRRELAAAAEHR